MESMEVLQGGNLLGAVVHLGGVGRYVHSGSYSDLAVESDHHRGDDRFVRSGDSSAVPWTQGTPQVGAPVTETILHPGEKKTWTEEVTATEELGNSHPIVCCRAGNPRMWLHGFTYSGL